MDELIKTFHIDWTLLLAQAINFAIVFLVLYFFGVRPLMKLMHERAQKIEQGIKNAEVIEENLKASAKEKQKIINEGHKKSQEIVLAAEKESEEVRQSKIVKTKKEAERIVTDAKVEINNEREKMLREVKSELGELILMASQKITDHNLGDKQQAKLIDQVLIDLQKTEI